MRLLIRSAAPLALALATALPAAATTPPAPVEQAPIDPATLSAARDIAAIMLPDGVYSRLLKDVLPGVMGQMRTALPSMMLREALKSEGIAAARVDKLTSAEIDEIMNMFDPAHAQRSDLLHQALMTEITAMLATQEPQLREAYAQAFTHRFTPQQLQDVRLFAQTPAGSSFISGITLIGSDPAIQQQVKILMTNMIQSMPNMIEKAKVDIVAAKLPAARRAKDLTAAQRARLRELLGTDALK